MEEGTSRFTTRGLAAARAAVADVATAAAFDTLAGAPTSEPTVPHPLAARAASLARHNAADIAALRASYPDLSELLDQVERDSQRLAALLGRLALEVPGATCHHADGRSPSTR